MDKTAVIYWSGTGNTEAMAKAIAQGIREGGAEADVFEVSEINADAAAAYARLALGCPSMGDEVLEEGEFEPFFTELEDKLEGKKIALFGSYGWGDGQWMRDWVSRAQAAKAQVFGEGLIAQGEADEDACVGYGSAFTVF